jgi:hypothetical protein
LASGRQGREARTARTCRRERQGRPSQVDGEIVAVGDRLLGARPGKITLLPSAGSVVSATQTMVDPGRSLKTWRLRRMSAALSVPIAAEWWRNAMSCDTLTERVLTAGCWRHAARGG